MIADTKLKRWGVFKDRQWGLGVGVIPDFHRVTILIGPWNLYWRWSLD